MTPPAPVRWARSRRAAACSAARWCWPAATATTAESCCARPCSMATRPSATARWRATERPTRWRPCCRCSTRWPAATTSRCCTPAPAARCGSNWRMAEARPLRREDVAVVIPALNESLRIRGVVEAALAQVGTVIVVDAGSTDDTVERIADLSARVLRHPRRLGKGAALRDGFAEAERLGARAVVTMDGDGQHSAADIPRLVAAANRHPGCVIVGARLHKRTSQPPHRRLGNDFGDWGIAWGCGFRVVDSQSGQRLYPREVFTLRDVPGEGFVFEAQMLISAARQARARVVAVPIETRYAGGGPRAEFRK